MATPLLNGAPGRCPQRLCPLPGGRDGRPEVRPGRGGAPGEGGAALHVPFLDSGHRGAVPSGSALCREEGTDGRRCGRAEEEPPDHPLPQLLLLLFHFTPVDSERSGGPAGGYRRRHHRESLYSLIPLQQLL
ncbi:hypothetical protein H920_11981 [Fukomys damarensis]|uniref:Uncharacterized protein n=1 Tax=Fukomys damarensis TaxID=885580 RepID=A0A091D682_FUKDA|nr:hypothetical protein H920_11981 [Fukomys damarensis]